MQGKDEISVYDEVGATPNGKPTSKALATIPKPVNLVIDAISKVKTKNSELIELVVNGSKTRFPLGVRSLLSGRKVYAIGLIYGSISKSPTGIPTVYKYEKFLAKSYLTIQDTAGIVRIKDKPIFALTYSTEPMYLEKMQINFEKSYISVPELITYTDGVDEIPIPDSALLLEIYFE